MNLGAAKKYSSDNKGICLFFEDFAKNRNFDPLIAANWYKIPRKQVLMVSTIKYIALGNTYNIGK